MNIKKVDDKPMVIHTKEKPQLKIKGAPETKIKGRQEQEVRQSVNRDNRVYGKASDCIRCGKCEKAYPTIRVIVKFSVMSHSGSMIGLIYSERQKQMIELNSVFQPGFNSEIRGGR